jgi:hypothetical protein
VDRSDHTISGIQLDCYGNFSTFSPELLGLG